MPHVLAITPENIIQGIDGEPLLDNIRQKTKKDYQVPLLLRALEILGKYKDNLIVKRQETFYLFHQTRGLMAI